MITCYQDKLDKLKEWNLSQAYIWRLLYNKYFVDINDTVTFILFSEFFEHFVISHKRPPSFIESIYYLRYKSL